MPVSRDLRARVVQTLDPLGPVTCHRLFGGVGLYRGARLFGILHNDRLYLRVDDATQEWFEQHGMGPFKPYDGRPPATGITKRRPTCWSLPQRSVSGPRRRLVLPSVTRKIDG